MRELSPSLRGLEPPDGGYRADQRVLVCDDLSVPDDSSDLVCRRCDRLVRLNREHYETFERMHYVCFHYEFEHGLTDADADPDEDCGVPGCPSAPAVRHKARLVATVRELLADWSDGPPANWENQSLPEYLESLAAWLEDSDGYYANRGVPVPWNGWEVVAEALRAATVYE